MTNKKKGLPRFDTAYLKSLPKFDKSVSWLCWAYNEEELIKDYVIRAHRLLESTVKDYEIVVVDDCSSDRTNEIVRNLQKKIPRIILIRNDTNRNVGFSSQRAIHSATKEYLFWQTIDWSYDISFLRIFLELLDCYDIVLGVRRAPVHTADKRGRPILDLLKLFDVQHITRRSDTIPKAFVSLINYIMVRSLFGVPLSDFQNVVFYPTRLIQGINFESNSSFTNPEGLIKSYWSGASIAEVPISFLPREAGEAKGTRLRAIDNSVRDIFRLWFKWIILGKRGAIKKGTIKRLNPDEWEMLFPELLLSDVKSAQQGPG